MPPDQDAHDIKEPKVAVLIPCYNEAVTIAGVIADFRGALPQAGIYVCDNNSTDGTGPIAAQAGALVLNESRQGKGYAVRRLLNEVEADFYLLVDGDGTYPAATAAQLLKPVLTGQAHMVVGTRLAEHSPGAFRGMHKFGNRLITGTINLLFKSRLADVLSGYRVLTRSSVKAIPLVSKGFEIETELTLAALDFDLTVTEVPIPYGSRPKGSPSKLNTWRDGMLILRTISNIFRDYRPLLFFGTLAAILIVSGLVLGVPVIMEFLRTGLVPRLPTAVLAASLELLAFQLIGVGLVLDTMARQRRYLQQIWWQQAQTASRPSRLAKP